MNRACWTAVLTVGLLTLALCGAVRAADSGPDFAPPPPAGFWTTNGMFYDLPKLDSGGL